MKNWGFVSQLEKVCLGSTIAKFLPGPLAKIFCGLAQISHRPNRDEKGSTQVRPSWLKGRQISLANNRASSTGGSDWSHWAHGNDYNDSTPWWSGVDWHRGQIGQRRPGCWNGCRGIHELMGQMASGKNFTQRCRQEIRDRWGQNRFHVALGTKGPDEPMGQMAPGKIFT